MHTSSGGEQSRQCLYTLGVWGVCIPACYIGELRLDLYTLGVWGVCIPRMQLAERIPTCIPSAFGGYAYPPALRTDGASSCIPSAFGEYAYLIVAIIGLAIILYTLGVWGGMHTRALRAGEMDVPVYPRRLGSMHTRSS